VPHRGETNAMVDLEDGPKDEGPHSRERREARAPPIRQARNCSWTAASLKRSASNGMRKPNGEIAVATMKVAQVRKPGADFEIVEREIPRPEPGQVRIRVQACGVCQSGSYTKGGALSGHHIPAPAGARGGRRYRPRRRGRSSMSMSSLVDGLGDDGVMVVVGARRPDRSLAHPSNLYNRGRHA
jgi:hypothetical protein